MLKIKEISVVGYEKVIEGIDPEVGLHCFIAVHSTAMGPALGGTRLYPYASPEEALEDALCLARGMTYKSAVAENGLGGGKSVIIADPRDKNEALLLTFGAVVDYLKGKYIAAEDVGTTTDDMVIVRERTPYVAALPTDTSSGDPSRFTAWGVFRGMQAVAKKLWGNPSLQGRTIAIQGVGNVGVKLAELLFWEGADLLVTDRNTDLARHVAAVHGAQALPPEDFLQVRCDILAPCAMGGVLNSDTIPSLQCKAVAGSANNQLLNPEDGESLRERGLLYAPDYVINAGGIINAAAEFDPEGYDASAARDRVNQIYQTLLSIFDKSEQQQRSTSRIADELAEYKLSRGIGKRMVPIF